MLDINEDKVIIPERYRKIYNPISFVLFGEEPVHCFTAFVIGISSEIGGLRFTYDTGRTVMWGSAEGAALSFFLDITKAERLKKLVLQPVDGFLKLEV
jgi:hypothetical protein